MAIYLRLYIAGDFKINTSTVHCGLSLRRVQTGPPEIL